MSFSLPLFIYRLLGSREFRTSRTPIDLENNPARRPSGQIIWIHTPNPTDYPVMAEFISRVADEFPDCWFLVTGEGAQAPETQDLNLYQNIKSDSLNNAKKFLDFWKPDLAVWLSDHLLPILINETSDRKIPLVLLDSGAAFGTAASNWFLPRVTRQTLRKFDRILSGDEATSMTLISAGAQSQNVKTTGALQLTTTPPRCNETEWDIIAGLLASRPVWLATQIQLANLESILAAHSQANRRSHRLIMILVPADFSQTLDFQKILKSRGVDYSVRSEGEEPEPANQIYLADTEDEAGLWYRLAPVCFIDNNDNESDQVEVNPLEAAALGSVVIHCPGSRQHEIAYQRLERAGASRPISHLGELAVALESVLAPDRAAVMAHAAWQITSAGAEAMDAALEEVVSILELRNGVGK